MIQGRGKGSFAYKLVSESGPDHNKTFVVQAVIDDTLITEGMGKTKKAAEQAAAYQAILELRRREAT